MAATIVFCFALRNTISSVAEFIEETKQSFITELVEF